MSIMDIKYNQFKQQQNMINIESGYNVLKDNGIIKDPPINTLRRDQFFINLNINIMNIINSKLCLNQNDIKLCQNTGGGNCFFKVISQFYHNTEIYHAYYRKKLAFEINIIKNSEANKFPYIYKKNNETLTFADYFNQMIITGNFAGNYEIVKMSQILHCNIIIYNNFNFSEEDEKFKFDYETMISDNDILNPYYPIILIGWVNNIHYILIFPKDHPNDLICNLIIHDKSLLANYNEYYTNCNQTIIIDKIKSKYKNNDKNIKKNNKKEETLALEAKNKTFKY